MRSPLFSLWRAAGVVITLAALAPSPASTLASAAQPRSGSTAIAFLTALSDGDLDTAMSLLTDDVRVYPLDGPTLRGQDAARTYFADFPRPIVVRLHHPIPYGEHEVFLIAGDLRLRMDFHGASGHIGTIVVELDPAADPPSDGGGADGQGG